MRASLQQLGADSSCWRVSELKAALRLAAVECPTEKQELVQLVEGLREQEAISIANASAFGLTHYVQSGDVQRTQRVARRLRAGMVQANGSPRAAGSPFGGYKQSGNGREGGVHGLMEYLEVKSVSGWNSSS